MDLKEIISSYFPLWVVVILALLMSIIQISKIQINPWTSIANVIRSFFNKPFMEILQELRQEISDLKNDVENEKKERARDATFSYRNSIINAANDLRKGEQFTRSKYNTLIDMHKRYNNLVDENQLPNDVLEYDYGYILERMREADENGEFM